LVCNIGFLLWCNQKLYVNHARVVPGIQDKHVGLASYSFPSTYDNSYMVPETSSTMASSSNPLFGFPISEKLNKQNFALWSAQFLAAIRGARLEGHLNGKTVIPDEEIEQKQGEKPPVKIPNPAYEAGYTVDQQVMGFLLTSLSKEMLTQVTAARTPTQAWKEIEDTFVTKSRAQKINVRLALTTTRKGDMSISEYIAKMRAL
jgi:hypothetical protein